MRYIEKYGGLTPEIVRSNITMISYNQAPFNSLYRGALGHDDLISFTRLAVERFPVIKKKISDKYQVVFIDEYQDLSLIHISSQMISEIQAWYKIHKDELQYAWKVLHES